MEVRPGTARVVPYPPLGPAMRLRRSRRRTLTLLSTRPAPGVQPGARLARRRRFRFARTGALLAVVGLLRLARTARVRWRISLACCGVLLEVLVERVLRRPEGAPSSSLADQSPSQFSVCDDSLNGVIECC